MNTPRKTDDQWAGEVLYNHFNSNNFEEEKKAVIDGLKGYLKQETKELLTALELINNGVILGCGHGSIAKKALTTFRERHHAPRA